MKIRVFPLFIIGLCLSGLQAQNPYMPLWEFIPDGEPYVFEDPDQPGRYRVYVYGSHDMLEQYYCGRDQVVWSAPTDNLADWRCDGVIFESVRDAQGRLLSPDGEGDVLYAPDVAEVKHPDGSKSYYLYPNNQAGGRRNMVARSDRPDGPFEVCNWDPKDPTRTLGPLDFDPAVLVDDDGRVYGYWGFGNPHVAELDPATMATVKPGTKVTEHMVPAREEDKTFRFFEASSIRKIKDKYVFVYSRETNAGECGLPKSNYTLAYAYSQHPTGPWTYGGTLIDGRGLERRPDGTCVFTAVPNGNTHGSLCQINGRWWVFYHRQAGTTEYSRQAMVAPVDVEVMEGPDGYVRISQAEFTCEGFATEGLDPFRRWPAGIACYFTGPEPAWQEYPRVVYPGSHTEIFRHQYQGQTDLYDPACNRCTVAGNTAGSVVGYKYFDLRKTYGRRGLKLLVEYRPQTCLPAQAAKAVAYGDKAGGAQTAGSPKAARNLKGRMEIWLDRPNREEGGVRLASLRLKVSVKDSPAARENQPEDVGSDSSANPADALAAEAPRTARIRVPALRRFNGKHALFLVFHSPAEGVSLCELESLQFTARP